ncbi:MAG TPA: hypothetical protein VIJ87_04885 [Pyrinomonadaceae bacterium]
MSRLLIQGGGGAGTALLMQGAPGQALLTQGNYQDLGGSGAYLSLPGSAGNYLSAPHNAAYNPAGDFTVIAYVLSPDWTPSTEQTIASKYVSAANGAWRMLIDNSPLGMASLAISIAGVADQASGTVTTESITGVAANEGVWLKMEFETSTGLVDMFYSKDPPYKEPETITWTTLQLNRAATAGVLGAGNTANLEIGSFNGGANSPFNGRIYRVAGYTSLTEATGNKIFDMDPKDWVSGSSWVSSRTGETWTLNGTASVVK